MQIMASYCLPQGCHRIFTEGHIFAGNLEADVALGEDEFDAPGLQVLVC